MTAASGNHDAAPAVSRMATVAVGETLDLSDSIQRFAGRNGA